MILNLIIPIILIVILLKIYFKLRLKKLYEKNSPLLGKIEVFEKQNKEKVLTTNSYPQGLSIENPSIKKSYWYKVADLAASYKKNSNILNLGLGANTIPSLIEKLNPSSKQTIIEIDPYIIEACKKFFNLDNLKNSKIIQADAFTWVNKNLKPETKYDVIIVDIFLGAPPYHDIKSNSPEFVKNLSKLLKKDGMLIFNRPAHKPEIREDGENFAKFLKTLFKNVEIFDIRDPRGFRNHIITATQTS